MRPVHAAQQIASRDAVHLSTNTKCRGLSHAAIIVIQPCFMSKVAQGSLVAHRHPVKDQTTGMLRPDRAKLLKAVLAPSFPHIQDVPRQRPRSPYKDNATAIAPQISPVFSSALQKTTTMKVAVILALATAAVADIINNEVPPPPHHARNINS